MSVPLVCPETDRRPRSDDCPLYEQRVGYSNNDPLRRAILTTRRSHPVLADLIRAEQRAFDAARVALPPGPRPIHHSILDQLTEEMT